MKTRHLFIAFAAIMLLGATMPVQAQNKKKKVKRPTTTATTTSTTTAEVGKGDLPIFDLRGPVKSVKMETVFSADGGIFLFDRKGKWTKMDGVKAEEAMSSTFFYDDHKRLAAMGMGNTSIEFTYDNHGNVAKTNEVGTIYESTTVYTYNQEGEVTKISSRFASSGSKAENTIYNVTILDRDSHGNWTKRKVIGGGENKTETRTITYY